MMTPNAQRPRHADLARTQPPPFVDDVTAGNAPSAAAPDLAGQRVRTHLAAAAEAPANRPHLLALGAELDALDDRSLGALVATLDEATLALWARETTRANVPDSGLSLGERTDLLNRLARALEPEDLARLGAAFDPPTGGEASAAVERWRGAPPPLAPPPGAPPATARARPEGLDPLPQTQHPPGAPASTLAASGATPESAPTPPPPVVDGRTLDEAETAFLERQLYALELLAPELEPAARRELADQLLRLRRDVAPADEGGAPYATLHETMHATNDLFHQAGFDHLLPTHRGRIVEYYDGYNVPGGRERMRGFRISNENPNNPATETYRVPLHRLSGRKQRSLGREMLRVIVDRAGVHDLASLERLGGVGASGGRFLGPVRAALAPEAVRAGGPGSAREADVERVMDEIEYFAVAADNRTELRRLSDRFYDMASLTLTGWPSAEGLDREALNTLDRWLGARSLGALGFSRTETIRGGDDDGVSTRDLGEYGNFGRTTYHFALAWLGSPREQRLDWLGLGEGRWEAARAFIVAGREARSASNDARDVARFLHSPVRFAIDEWARPLVGYALDPIIEADIPLVSDAALAADNLIDGALDIAEIGATGLSRTAEELLEGDLDGAGRELGRTVEEGAEEVGRTVLGTAGIVASGLTDFIEELTGQIETRRLNRDEIAAMRGVFGDSIDYDEVEIKRGGIRESANLNSHVVGNEIFLQEVRNDNLVFDADGTLTAEGLSLLAHELTHVWQYQNEGIGYAGESLFEQLEDGNEAYAWLTAIEEGRSFLAMNVEQQAEIAELIFEARRRAGGDLTRAAFIAVAREAGDLGQTATLTPEQFETILDAAVYLTAGRTR